MTSLPTKIWIAESEGDSCSVNDVPCEFIPSEVKGEVSAIVIDGNCVSLYGAQRAPEALDAGIWRRKGNKTFAIATSSHRAAQALLEVLQGDLKETIQAAAALRNNITMLDLLANAVRQALP